MIRLTDIGAGDDSNPLDVDETFIASLSADPVEADRTVVTMQNGMWFLVSESVDEIEALIALAKET